jgi:hypothetical protein
MVIAYYHIVSILRTRHIGCAGGATILIQATERLILRIRLTGITITLVLGAGGLVAQRGHSATCFH